MSARSTPPFRADQVGSLRRPECGFSSNYLGNPVTIDDEKRKLELVVSTAQSVWGSA